MPTTMAAAASSNSAPQGALDKERRVKKARVTLRVSNAVCYILPFDENGRAMFDYAEDDWHDIPKWATRLGATEIYIMSHGWNNSPVEARNLYEEYFSQVEAARSMDSSKTGQALYLGFYWPSKKWAQTWKEFADGPHTGMRTTAVGAAAVIDGTVSDASPPRWTPTLLMTWAKHGSPWMQSIWQR